MKSILYLFLFLTITIQTSCYELRFAPKNTAKPHYSHKAVTVWTFFWGSKNPVKATDLTDCNGKGVSDIKISTNLGGVALCILTLGIVLPYQVRFECAKDPVPNNAPGTNDTIPVRPH